MSEFLKTIERLNNARIDSALARRAELLAKYLESDMDSNFEAIESRNDETRKIEKTRRESNTAIWISKDTADSVLYMSVERGIRANDGTIMDSWYNVKRVLLTVESDGEIVKNVTHNLYIRRINDDNFDSVPNKRGLTARELACGMQAINKAESRGEHGFGFSEIKSILDKAREMARNAKKAIDNASK